MKIEYGIENDMWLKQRKHIYHLTLMDEGCLIIVATYSLKTKILQVKCANKHIPQTHILQEFVTYCENKGDMK